MRTTVSALRSIAAGMILALGLSPGASAADAPASSASTFVTATVSRSTLFQHCLLVEPEGAPGAARSKLVLLDGKTEKVVNVVGFDRTGMTFRITVADKTLHQPYDGWDIWRGDCVQMAFDVLGTRTKEPAGENVELGFSCVKGKPFLHVYRSNPERPFESYRIAYAFSGANSNLVYDIDLPWDVLYPLTYDRVSAGIGFSFLANCATGKGAHAYRWGEGIARNKSPAAYGMLVFDKAARGIAAELVLNEAREYYFDTADVAGSVWVPCQSPAFTSVAITLTLNGPQGPSQTLTLPVQVGENRLDFTIPARRFALGDSQIAMTAYAMPGHVLLREKTLPVKCVSLETVLRQVALLKQNIDTNLARLDQRLAAYAGRREQPRDALVSRGVASVFLPCIDIDLKHAMYALALREAKDLDQVVTQAVVRLDRGNVALSAERSVAGLAITNGVFCNGTGQPVFPFGAWGGTMVGPLAVQKDLGFTIIRLALPDAGVLFGDVSLTPSRAGPDKVRRWLHEPAARAVSNNMVWTFGAETEHFPKWFTTGYRDVYAGGNHFFPLDPDHPEVKRLIETYAATYAREIAGGDARLFTGFLGVDLHSEPAFYSQSPNTLHAFRAWLRGRYADIGAVNRAWGTAYREFDTIQNPKAQFTSKPVLYYDWCVFNNARFVGWFARQKEAIVKNGGGNVFPVRVKVMNHVIWNGRGAYGSGYDREALADVTDINGCDTAILPKAEGPYSLVWRDQSISYDFMKAVAPQQPIYEGEWHSVEGIGFQREDIPQAYMRCALELGVWHGMDACDIWSFLWGRFKENASWLKGSLHTQPLVLEAYCQEAIWIGDHMERFVALQNAPRPIGLYYSLASAIYDSDAYIDTLKAAYEALYFHDVPITFVTERMLAAGKAKTAGLQLLVFPNARHVDPAALGGLDKLAAQGVKFAYVGGENLSRDTQDRPIANPTLPPAVLTATPSNLVDTAALASALDGAVRAAGIVPAFTVQDAKGAHPAAVEARFAALAGKPIGYVVNLGRQPAEVRVTTGAGKAAGLRDVRTGHLYSPGELIQLEPWGFVNVDVEGP